MKIQILHVLLHVTIKKDRFDVGGALGKGCESLRTFHCRRRVRRRGELFPGAIFSDTYTSNATPIWVAYLSVLVLKTFFVVTHIQHCAIIFLFLVV